MERRIEAVIEDLRQGAEGQPPRPATVLIGAGCSIAAGIPLASGFVKMIEARYGDAYARAAE